MNDADREGNRSGDEKDVGFILEAGDDMRQPCKEEDEQDGKGNPTSECFSLTTCEFHVDILSRGGLVRN